MNMYIPGQAVSVVRIYPITNKTVSDDYDYVYLYIYIYTCLSIYVYIYIYIYPSIYRCLCLCIYIVLGWLGILFSHHADYWYERDVKKAPIQRETRVTTICICKYRVHPMHLYMYKSIYI